MLQTIDVLLLLGTLSLLAKFAMDLDNMTGDALSQAVFCDVSHRHMPDFTRFRL